MNESEGSKERKNDKSNEPELRESCTDGIYSSQLISDEHPTDRDYYADVLDANLMRFIVETGSCRPYGPFPRDSKNRCFGDSFYYNKNYKIKIPVTWLCYSKKLNAPCEVCWLFGERNDPSYRENWSNGTQDWQGLSKKNYETCYF